MAITPTEGGLTQEQWDDLTELVEGAIFQVLLYQWNPEFTISVTGTSPYYDFDAIAANGTIYRGNSTEIEYLNVSTWSPLGSYTPATGQSSSAPVSLIYDAGLYVFAPTTTGISLRVYSGGSWGSWSEIITDSDVLFIAATDKDTVHYVTYDDNHYHLKVAKFSGSWSATDSDIYLGFQITSFAAQRLNGKDILTCTMLLPGVTSSKVIGTQLVKYVLPAGGVVSFSYQYGSWSDHNVIDLVEQYSSYRFREGARLSVIGDVLWLTVYTSEGSPEHPVTGFRIYNSKDGLHWSRGELIIMPYLSRQGVIVVQLGTSLYALTNDAVMTAPSTLWFGNPATSTIQDVSRHVTELNVNRTDMQQLTLALANPDSWSDGSFFGGDHTIAALLRTGFFVDSEELMVQVGLFEIDTVRRSDENPQKALLLIGRDRMSWLASKSQSEQAITWDPQAVGVDSYQDATGTGYGGTSHTAPFKGSYKAESGVLQLKSSNAEGVAASTYLYDTWNGAISSHTNLSLADNDEYTGVFFRAQDKDNLSYWRYEQADDKIHFGVRVEGEDTDLWVSAAKSWDLVTDTRCFRVEFRYSRIRLYSGDNQGAVFGVLWDLEQSLLVDGGDALENGFVGTIGKGYSAQDDWENDQDPFPAYELPPAYPEYVYIVAEFEYGP